MTITDIVADIYRRTKTNSTSFVAADMLIPINQAFNIAVAHIIIANGWQYDDSNQTDLPIATTNLVSSQQDYSLAAAHLTIDRVEIKDSSGNWIELDNIDQQDLKRDRKIALGAYQSTAGTPREYDISGTSVFLYPAPNYNSTGGLKVYFTRGPSEFSSGDVSTGTKAPGIPSLFHPLIPIWVSYDYCVVNIPDLAPGYLNEFNDLIKMMEGFYGQRNKDHRGRLTASTDSNK